MTEQILARHLRTTGMFYPHGFLGERAMRTYIRLVDGNARARVALPPSPPATVLAAWGGLGAHLVLAQLANGAVPDPLWRRFARGVTNERQTDFYTGIDGALPVLALVGAKRGPLAVKLSRLAHRSAERRLRASVAKYACGGSVNLGFAHGLAGTLLGFEVGNALLGLDGSALRKRAIDVLLETAIHAPAGPTWPDASHVIDQRSAHGLCNGGPGICLAALLGYRYTGDATYAQLIELALRTVPLDSPRKTLCCGTIGRVEVLIEAYRTTDDRSLLKLARSLFRQVDRGALRGKSWRDGALGHDFTALRLSRPREVDLPALPSMVVRLNSR